MVNQSVVGQIKHGLLVYLGVGKSDVDADTRYIVDKIVSLRVFEDDDQKMNRSVGESDGAVLLVSQFTLYGDVRRGRRPSFDDAMAPAQAELMYNSVGAQLRNKGVCVETGVFRANMQVTACVDGPVTILLDSHKQF